MLTNKAVQALLRVERLMDEAGRAMVPRPAPDAAAADSPAPASPAATQPPPKRADGKVGNVAASN
jgi:hypothetical protein